MATPEGDPEGSQVPVLQGEPGVKTGGHGPGWPGRGWDGGLQGHGEAGFEERSQGLLTTRMVTQRHRMVTQRQPRTGKRRCTPWRIHTRMDQIDPSG